jgi:hypothetical protein
MRHGLLATYLEELAGDDGCLKRMKVSQRGIDVPGNALAARAVVTGKAISPEGYGVVELEACVENDKGEKNLPGVATLLLPRKNGPAVPTSFGCPRERVAWAFAE